MKTLALAGLVAATLVWVGWTERRHRLQSHQISLAGGTKVTIEYNTQDEQIRYGNYHHLLVLRDAVKLLESIVADERKKETR